MPPSVPHFSVPFTFDVTGHVETVEQDSLDDVASCLEVAFLTEPGMRPEVPTFGVPSEVFQLQPLNLNEMLQAALEWEPRADLILSQATASDVLVDRVTAVLSLRRTVVNI